MKVVNLRVDHVVNPIGYKLDKKPVFTYVTEDASGKKQTAAEIRVAKDVAMTDIIADTGVSSEVDSLGCAIELELAPRTRYYWTVTVQSDAGEEATSDVAYFETGKMDEEWTARWITCENGDRHPLFTKNFAASAGKTIAQARLYISGLGLYHATINGENVTEEKLTPYYTAYDKTVQYQTYDVTGLIGADNTIAVALGNGWYSGRFGFSSKEGEGGYYGNDYRLIAELHIAYADGSEDVIATDDSWDVTRTNITFSNIYDGEQVDDTLEPVAPVKAELLKNLTIRENPISLEERLSLPVIGHEEIEAEMLITPAGETVFDTHQNMAGSFKLRVHEPKGTRIHVQVGEVLQQGNFYNDNLRTAKAEYIYISDGEEHVLEPVFTFYGYRYARVTGAANIKQGDFTAVAYYSDFTPAGEMVTGHDKLNQFISNVKWGQKSNFVDVPTDCPQRDERMGWTADTQVFVPTASFFTDSFAFYKKWLKDVRNDQLDGCIPDVVPAHGVQHSGSSVWSDAATIVPWTLYEFYGDKSILEESLDSMAAWVDWVTRFDGDDHAYERTFHYGDWLALDNPSGSKEEVMGGTSVAYIADVYYLNSARLTAKAAAVVGRKDVQDKYEALADKLLKYIQDEFFTPNGRLAIDTQTGYILALRHKLNEANRGRLAAGLVAALKVRSNKLATGFTGTPFLAPTLADIGEYRLAYGILLSEEYPGWLYEVNMGATTVWERWNSMEADGSVSSTGMNSFNHYAYGSIAEWMWKGMAGIAPDEKQPGFRHAIMSPIPNYEVGSVKAAYNSPAGRYESEWKILDKARIYLKFTVPFNCTATITLPYHEKDGRVVEATAGTYEFEYDTTEPLKTMLTVDSTLEELLGNPASKAVISQMMGGGDLSQIPAQMRLMSLRDMADRYAPAMKDYLDAINSALANI